MERLEEKKPKSKMGKAMLLGALAGAVISLFDKDTRQAAGRTGKAAASNIKQWVLHPDEAVQQVKDASAAMMDKVEQISEDVSAIVETVEEFAEVPAQLVQTVMETKQAFEKNPEIEEESVY